MEPVRWGVLGAARIARENVVPGMRKSPLCDIRAVASRSLEKAEAEARLLGIPKAYGSYEALLADPEIEAVYIPLPNHLHVPMTLKAAEAGKHVLCEKPIAMNAVEAESLRAVADKVIFQEAFMVRHHPQWRRVRELVREGAIGRVSTVIAAFSYPAPAPTDIRWDPGMAGGALWDVGCYPLTLARFVFECEPIRVSAVSDMSERGVDVSTSGAVDFGEGRQLSFWCGMSHGQTQFARVVGESGSITVPFPYYDNLEPADHLIVDRAGRVETESLPGDAYEHQGADFSRAVRGGTAPEWGVENAIASMRLLDAAARSARSGRWETV